MTDFKKIPHAIVILFIIMILVTLLTYFLPAGNYERVLVEGKNRVIPGSYSTISNTPVDFFQLFKAIPLGFKSAVDIIFIVLAGGIMFGILDRTKAIENAIGYMVKTLGVNKKRVIIVIMTFVFGLLGVAVGYENNIAMVPIAAVLSLAIGGDLILAAGISVGAMTVGFGLSPINPYTVGTGHNLAELSLFSGAGLRSILCFLGLSIMAYYNLRYFKKISISPEKSLGKDLDTEGFVLNKKLSEYNINSNNKLVLGTFSIGLLTVIYGVFNWHWYIVDLSAMFLIIALICAIIGKMSPNEISHSILDSVSKAAPGAFMVGFATTIKVLMEMGNINDTISHNLSLILEGSSLYFSAIGMSIAQCFINFFIPSGSGQALATLPVMLPLGESLGLTRQTTILAFQIGDGVTNLFNPTLGGLIAMLSMCRVPIDKWIKFIFPLALLILFISWIFLIIAVAIGYQ